MKFETVQIASWPHNFATPIHMAITAGIGMSVVFATLSLKEINGFTCDNARCSITAPSDNMEAGKVCTRCQKWRLTREYHRNASKIDQLESHCKSCVSKRKERSRMTQQRLKRRGEEFNSVIVGSPDSEVLARFAVVFGAAMKEVLYEDDKTKAHTG